MCDKCKKKTKELWSVGPYGWLRQYIDENKEYCTKCFDVLVKKAEKKWQNLQKNK